MHVVVPQSDYKHMETQPTRRKATSQTQIAKGREGGEGERGREIEREREQERESKSERERESGRERQRA